MNYIERSVEARITAALARGKSVFLFGARQTGKTTLVSRLKAPLSISFIRPEVRLRYEKSPDLLAGEVEGLGPNGRKACPLVLLDEVQKVPQILDVVQDLIDRNLARFVLTGSSARKLRHSARTNLLPGRVVVFHLDPFSSQEYPDRTLQDHLLDGSLPGMVGVRLADQREEDLAAYVTTYLEEEIRAEAVVRNLGSFARFLELAAAESGGIVNLRKLASEIGVAHTTIAAYYQILEDCLVVERMEPLTTSATRKKLTKSDKYLFFDLGVRRVAAHEGRRPPNNRWGELFEQFVGLELVRWSRVSGQGARIRFWRDPDGPEVDWVVDREGRYLPIEVKWSECPDAGMARHLNCFLNEYPTAERGLVVCRIPRRLKLSNRVMAIPWQSLRDELG